MSWLGLRLPNGANACPFKSAFPRTLAPPRPTVMTTRPTLQWSRHLRLTRASSTTRSNPGGISRARQNHLTGKGTGWRLWLCLWQAAAAQPQFTTRRRCQLIQRAARPAAAGRPGTAAARAARHAGTGGTVEFIQHGVSSQPLIGARAAGTVAAAAERMGSRRRRHRSRRTAGISPAAMVQQ
jgi:hypothetical protein